MPLTTTLLDLKAFAEAQSIKILPITVEAISLIQQMPFHHKDPFDRIIAATALVTGSILLSADTILTLTAFREHGRQTEVVTVPRLMNNLT